MNQTISVKQILYDIFSIKEQVIKLYKGKERYKGLITFLEAKDYFNDEDIPYPTLKQVESDTGLKTHQIRKQLNEIYESLFNYEYTFDFNDVEIYFSVNYFERYANVKCSNLSQLPRVGENISLPFLKAKIGTDFFYVDDIRHSLLNNQQIIDISLKVGRFNSYWYYRKHKALETGEIGLFEEFKLNDYQIKDKLGIRN